jgi:hypothetical protein
MLKEQGLSFSGENYEDINRWGQRMADTSITSEQVIYLAARKKYTNKTVHVFRSFTRAGQSNADDTGRAEAYEVVLEEWLLENLNQSYVIPEDFTAYRLSSDLQRRVFLATCICGFMQAKADRWRRTTPNFACS